MYWVDWNSQWVDISAIDYTEIREKNRRIKAAPVAKIGKITNKKNQKMMYLFLQQTKHIF